MCDKLILEDKQVSKYVDRRGHSDRDLPFGSRKSGKRMSVDFGQNVDVKIGMNPLRAIRGPHPQVTGTRMINCDLFDMVIRVSPWHDTMKNETGHLVENLIANTILKC